MADAKQKKRQRARRAGMAVGAAVIAALAVVGGLTIMSAAEAPVGATIGAPAAQPEDSAPH